MDIPCFHTRPEYGKPTKICTKIRVIHRGYDSSIRRPVFLRPIKTAVAVRELIGIANICGREVSEWVTTDPITQTCTTLCPLINRSTATEGTSILIFLIPHHQVIATRPIHSLRIARRTTILGNLPMHKRAKLPGRSFIWPRGITICNWSIPRPVRHPTPTAPGWHS